MLIAIVDQNERPIEATTPHEVISLDGASNRNRVKTN